MTTPDFKAMTPLELFDYSVAKIVEQARPSVGQDPRPGHTLPREVCLYRGPKDCRCGAGIFIHDDKYNVEMEGQVFSEVLKKFDIGWEPSYSQMAAIRAAQTAHDGSSSAPSFVPAFKEYAANLRKVVVL